MSLEQIAGEMAYSFSDPEYANKEKFPWDKSLDGLDYDSAVQEWMKTHILIAFNNIKDKSSLCPVCGSQLT